MTPAVPTPLTIFFVAQVAALATLAVAASWRAGVRLGEPPARNLRWAAGWAAGLLVLLGATYAAAASGCLRSFESFPPPMMRLFAEGTVVTLIVAFSPAGRRLVDGLSLTWLVGYQSFRIAVELFLFGMHRAGALPVQMTFEGQNFDVFTGLSALAVAGLAASGCLPRAVLRVWNLLGLALLATIVTIAVLSFPTAFRVFANEPANRIVAEPPFVWLPLFLVQAALFGHLLVFRWLRRNAGAGA